MVRKLETMINSSGEVPTQLSYEGKPDDVRSYLAGLGDSLGKYTRRAVAGTALLSTAACSGIGEVNGVPTNDPNFERNVALGVLATAAIGYAISQSGGSSSGDGPRDDCTSGCDID